MKKSWMSRIGSVVVLLVLLVLLAGLRLWFGRVAPTPEAFVAHTTLTAALTESEQTGKPVLVLATADWCPSCQVLKRGALADPKVTAWIEANAIPAYADFTDEKTPEAQKAGRLLGIQAFPTLVMLRDGEVVAKREGVVSTDKLLAWLKDVGGVAGGTHP